MDDLDRNLLEAWHLVAERLKRDPKEAARRHARRFNKNLSRPLRPFCLAIRASDTRLDAHATSAILAADPHGEHNYPHEVQVTAEVARSLTSPVSLPWPGQDLILAAARLGQNRKVMERWVRDGLLRVIYRNAQSCGKRGKDVPYVWSPTVLDPSSPNGAGPDGVFGTVWQHLAGHVPAGLDVELERHPVFAGYGDASPRARGYKFRCPGRRVLETPGLGTGLCGGENTYVHRGCGRLVSKLYLPTAVQSVAQAMGLGDAFEVEGLAGRWTPGGAGGAEGSEAEGERSFACHECWGILGISLAHQSGWNAFVTQISGGMLYGSEVEQPTATKVITRWKNRTRIRGGENPRPREREVGGLYLQGLTIKQIGNAMGIVPMTVYGHLARLRERYGVGSNAELRERLGEMERKAGEG